MVVIITCKIHNAEMSAQHKYFNVFYKQNGEVRLCGYVGRYSNGVVWGKTKKRVQAHLDAKLIEAI